MYFATTVIVLLTFCLLMYLYRITVENVKKRLYEITASSVLDETTKKHSIARILVEYKEQIVSEERAQASTFSTEGPVEQPGTTVDSQIEEPSKKRKRGGLEQIGQGVKDRIKAAKTTLMKLTLIKPIYDGWKDRVGDLVGPDQSYFHRNIRRTGCCIDSCHSGDLQGFATQAIGFTPSTYRCPNGCEKKKNQAPALTT
jgi:hypothetical protein